MKTKLFLLIIFLECSGIPSTNKICTDWYRIPWNTGSDCMYGDKHISVPIMHDDWVIVKCRINNEESRCLIDTGAPSTWVFNEIIGTNENNKFSKIDELQIGKVLWKNVYVISMKNYFVGPNGVSAIIGMDLLEDHSISINYMETFEFHVGDYKACDATDYKYLSINNRIWLEMLVGDVSGFVLFDTGSTHPMIDTYIMSQGVDIVGDVYNANIKVWNTDVKGIIATIPLLCVAGLCRQNVEIAGPYKFSAVGMSFFHDKKLEVDFKKEIIRICD